MAEDEMVADIVAIIGSLNVVLGEIDRQSVGAALRGRPSSNYARTGGHGVPPVQGPK